MRKRTAHPLFLCVVMLAAVLSLWPAQSRAQDLLDQYQDTRFKERTSELLEVLGQRVVPLKPVHLPSAADTVAPWLSQFQPKAEPETKDKTRDAPHLTRLSWEKVPQSKRSWFKQRYNNVEWTAEGMRYGTRLDTVSTRIIRAKLEGLFGAPSNTIVDILKERRPRGAEYIQFEYWFVLNDSIPLIVLDVDGPFEEGLVFAGDVAYQDILSEAKRVLVDKVMGTQASRYVDYYYAYDRRQWFLIGFDGDRHFLEEISRPSVGKGRPTLTDVELPVSATAKD